ncbi:MAG: macro domain-containing protein [Oscillospiraceae bacterium]|nr:macro domain-containing protein [Oscillospiraceae bacterium]
MPYQIIRSDITDLPFHVHAIVSPARLNPKEFGLGVEKQIHKKAGPELLKHRTAKGKIEIGQAAVTKAFNLNADYVIHTVAPVWNDGKHNEEQLLRQCYDSSLSVANKLPKHSKSDNRFSIAFPLIGSGNLGFSFKTAYRIATDAFRDFCENYDWDIYLVVFKEEDYQYCCKQQFNVKSCIDNHTVQGILLHEYSDSNEYVSPEETHKRIQNSRSKATWRQDIVNNTLDSMPSATFSQTVLALISCLGETDSAVYNMAYISGSHFGKIRSNPYYKPHKSTVIALAVALKLDLAQTTELLRRAGYAFHDSIEFDRIIIEFITQKQYDIDTINATLEEHGLQGFYPKERAKKKGKE